MTTEKELMAEAVKRLTRVETRLTDFLVSQGYEVQHKGEITHQGTGKLEGFNWLEAYKIEIPSHTIPASAVVRYMKQHDIDSAGVFCKGEFVCRMVV